MKKPLPLLFILASLLISCDESNIGSIELLGEWQLSEVLADPGDGSGTFQPVDGSDITIEFLDDGTFKTKSTFCQTDPDLPDHSTGRYDIARNVLIVDDCVFNSVPVEYSFEVNEQNQLIIHLQCIEPCANKYLKVNSNP